MINDKNNGRMRRNKHDLKPRYPVAAQQRPQSHVPNDPLCWIPNTYIDNAQPIGRQQGNATYSEHIEPPNIPATSVPCPKTVAEPTTPRNCDKAQKSKPTNSVPKCDFKPESNTDTSIPITRSGRKLKLTQLPEYIYKRIITDF